MRTALALSAMISLLPAACATSADRAAQVRQAVAAGAPDQALRLADRWGAREDDPLAHLERGALLEARGEVRAAAGALGQALGGTWLPPWADVQEFARQIYGVTPAPYRPTATESMTAAALALLAQLEAGDLAGAAASAKVFTHLRNQLYRGERRGEHVAFGSLLAGLAMEGLGRDDAALAYYQEVVQVRDLVALWRPMDALRGRAPADVFAQPMMWEPLEEDDTAVAPGEVLIVVKVGRAPGRRVARMPIEAAWARAEPLLELDPEVGAESLRAQGVTEIVYPELAPEGTRWERPSLTMDRKAIRLELVSDLTREVVREHQQAIPRMLAAAIERAVSGQGRLFLERPDLRSWATMPAQVYVARLEVPAGLHQVEIVVPGPAGQRRRAGAVRVPEGGLAVADLTVL